MNLTCSHCNRHHRGVCGIPAGVTLGYGAHLRGNGDRIMETYKPPSEQRSASTLNAVLATAHQRYERVVQMLKIISPELAEYAELLDRESKLANLIRQVGEQLEIRRH